MGKFFCDYCQTSLTHDSLSVRRNHARGKHHLQLYNAYYDNIINQYPEFDRINIDPTISNNIIERIYKGIPGSSTQIKNFKLQVPDTSIGLPNPPPNVLHLEYSNSIGMNPNQRERIQKNRVNKPYRYNNGSNSGSNSRSIGVKRQQSPMIREGSPRGQSIERGNFENRNMNTLNPVTNSLPGATTTTTTTTTNNNDNNAESGNGYGYGYGYGFQRNGNGYDSRRERSGSPSVNEYHGNPGYRQSSRGGARGGYRGRGGRGGYYGGSGGYYQGVQGYNKYGKRY